jgi:copper chaperone CopZ
METQTFTIPNITCGHCVMTIKNEPLELDGIKQVDGDPDTKTIAVEWDAPANRQKIIDLLREINYPAD